MTVPRCACCSQVFSFLTSYDVTKTGGEFLSTIVPLSNRLGLRESCEREAQAGRKDTDAKLVGASSDVSGVVDMPKPQTVSDVFVQELRAVLKNVKAHRSR